MMQLIEIPSSKRSSSEARLLLREYSHRINNEFASAIGAISVAAAHSADNEAKAVLAAVQDQLQNYAQVHHALQLLFFKHAFEAAQLCVSAAAILNKRRVCAEVLVTMNPQEFEKMRKQVIAVATAMVLGIATTATGTTAFARGGGGGGGGGGGHGGGFGGGGHGFGGGGFGGHGFGGGGFGGHGFGGGGFGGRGFAMGHGGFGHGRFGHGHFEGRRFGRGLYAYGGDYDYGYCNPYYYPYGCYGY
jgi:hypothetical protein